MHLGSDLACRSQDLTRYKGSMARPVGDFEKGKRQLLKLIKGLSGFSGCSATSDYYAKVLGKSRIQIQKYIKSLKDEGAIEVKTTPLLKDRNTGTFYRKRLITPIVKNVRTEPNVLTKEAPREPTAEEKLALAYEAIKAEEVAREEAFQRALAEEEFDRKAVLEELQRELAEQGIQMEL